MEDTLETLRGVIHHSCPTVPSQGYPQEVRQRVGRYARLHHAQGETWNRIGSSLGVSRSTVRNWAAALDAAPTLPTSSMVPVVVTAEERSEREPEPEVSGVVLISPLGFRLEGLSSDAAVEALGQLG